MPRYEITAPDGKTLVVEGSKPPTQEDAKRIFEQYKVQPERTTGEQVGGAVDVALNLATSAIAKPLSGLYGLTNLALPGNTAGTAAARQKQVEEMLTYPLEQGSVGAEYAQNIATAPVIKQVGDVMSKGSEYIGRKTLDVTGSPAAASIAKAAPEAIATYLGAKAPAGAAARAESKAIETAQQGAADMVRRTGVEKSNLAASDTVAALKAGKTRDIADIIDADPEYYKALDELGITAEPLPSYASRNPQFRGIEQSFAAMPTSDQHAQALAFSKDVSNVAAALQSKFTQFSDSADASIKWREAANKTIDSLNEAESAAWTGVDELIDKRVPAEPTNLMNFIQESTKDLALGVNDKAVPKEIKMALRDLAPQKRTLPDGTVETVPPTYANLDLLRKKIGAGLSKEGPFSDAQAGLLKKMYSEITDDLHAMAEKQGLVEQVKASKALTVQRKGLENDMQAILGKTLQKDIIPVIQEGAKALAKGGVEKWQRTMKALDPDTRKELVFTAISDQFTKTLKGEAKQLDTTGFLKWYDSTLGNKTIRKVIESDLPEGSLQAVDNLAKVSRGIAQASSQRIPTGVVNAVLKDDGGFLQRMIGKAGNIPGVTGRASSAVFDLLEKKTERAAATADLLADPQFQALLRNGVANGVAQGKMLEKAAKASEKRVMDTAKFKSWADTLTEDERAKLFNVGVASFLMQQQEQSR